MLADLGADVVKVEDPRGGDPARAMPPLADGTSVYFTLLNRNKRSVTLDLRAHDAAPVLGRLLADVDVVVDSFRPHTARRLGVDAATLRARHPRLICATITGFGQTGPYVERAAHDINYEALAGLLAVPGSPPRVPRMLLGDIGAAMNAAVGILAALVQRERTGAGAAIDVAIHDSALMWLLFPAARRLVAGGDRDPRDLPIGGADACYNVYETADGKWIALGALEPKFWRAFCEGIGRPEFVARQLDTGRAQAALLDEVRAIVRGRTQADWLAVFAGVDLCLAPVNSVEEALADAHLHARGAVAVAGGTTFLTTPIAVSREATAAGWDAARRMPVRPAPVLGAHTDEVLRAAGLDAAAIAALRAAHVI